MDDEASLLPRKLQAALEQSLEQRNDIINQDSDSESDEGEKPDFVALPICLQWTYWLSAYMLVYLQSRTSGLTVLKFLFKVFVVYPP